MHGFVLKNSKPPTTLSPPMATNVLIFLLALVLLTTAGPSRHYHMKRRLAQSRSPINRGHAAQHLSSTGRIHPALLKNNPIPKPTSVNWFSQYLDHFNIAPTSSSLWNQKYLVYDGYLKNGQVDKIFFYTGNEGGTSFENLLIY